MLIVIITFKINALCLILYLKIFGKLAKPKKLNYIDTWIHTCTTSKVAAYH